MIRTAVQYRKTAVYSRNRTVTNQDFVSTAWLWSGPYSTVFRTAVAVYGTVVSPSTGRWTSGNPSPRTMSRSSVVSEWFKTLHVLAQTFVLSVVPACRSARESTV